MSTRLQILLDERELDAIRTAAQRDGVTVSEWARNAMRTVRRSASSGDPSRKLAAIRVATEFEAPTGDIDHMLAEIEQGYTA